MKYASPLYWLILLSFIPVAVPLSNALMTFVARAIDLYNEVQRLDAVPH